MAQNTDARSSKDEDAPLTQEDLIQKPWKYIGYRDFARHASSTHDFLVLRRFDRVHCRLLLMLQDQVVELESELDALDSRLSKRSAPDIDNGSMRNDVVERKELLERLHRRVREYDDLLSQYTTLKSRPQPSQQNINAIRTWLANHYNPIHPLEAEFITSNNTETDLLSLVDSHSPHKSRLKRLLADHFIRIFPGASVTPQNVDAVVEAVASFLFFLAAAGMFLAPLWILAIVVVDDPFERLVTITGFLILFLAMLTLGMTARSFEIFAATAVYAVVLVMFLQVGMIADGSSGWGRFFEL